MSESKAVELLREWLTVADDDLRAVSPNGNDPEMCVVCCEANEEGKHRPDCLVGRTELLLRTYDSANQQPLVMNDAGKQPAPDDRVHCTSVRLGGCACGRFSI